MNVFVRSTRFRRLIGNSGVGFRSIDTHWISESGIVDLFFLTGPMPEDIFTQWGTLTGVTPLP